MKYERRTEQSKFVKSNYLRQYSLIWNDFDGHYLIFEKSSNQEITVFLQDGFTKFVRFLAHSRWKIDLVTQSWMLGTSFSGIYSH